jgi:hypothetical protein
MMANDLKRDPVAMSGRYEPTAVYFLDSDCVEYVKEDAFCIYDRIDNFLSLIFDETQLNVVGFKLKGFKCVFEKHIKPRYSELSDTQFIDLVAALEVAFTDAGNKVFSVDNEERVRAYKAAKKLVTQDRVRLRAQLLEAA